MLSLPSHWSGGTLWVLGTSSHDAALHWRFLPLFLLLTPAPTLFLGDRAFISFCISWSVSLCSFPVHCHFLFSPAFSRASLFYTLHSWNFLGVSPGRRSCLPLLFHLRLCTMEGIHTCLESLTPGLIFSGLEEACWASFLHDACSHAWNFSGHCSCRPGASGGGPLFLVLFSGVPLLEFLFPDGPRCIHGGLLSISFSG
jgi:hypothetical protein